MAAPAEEHNRGTTGSASVNASQSGIVDGSAAGGVVRRPAAQQQPQQQGAPHGQTEGGALMAVRVGAAEAHSQAGARAGGAGAGSSGGGGGGGDGGHGSGVHEGSCGAPSGARSAPVARPGAPGATEKRRPPPLDTSPQHQARGYARSASSEVLAALPGVGGASASAGGAGSSGRGSFCSWGLSPEDAKAAGSLAAAPPPGPYKHGGMQRPGAGAHTPSLSAVSTGGASSSAGGGSGGPGHRGSSGGGYGHGGSAVSPCIPGSPGSERRAPPAGMRGALSWGLGPNAYELDGRPGTRTGTHGGRCDIDGRVIASAGGHRAQLADKGAAGGPGSPARAQRTCARTGRSHFLDSPKSTSNATSKAPFESASPGTTRRGVNVGGNGRSLNSSTDADIDSLIQGMASDEEADQLMAGLSEGARAYARNTGRTIDEMNAFLDCTPDSPGTAIRKSRTGPLLDSPKSAASSTPSTPARRKLR
ncbi:hypothetical protein FOA52_008806 [Chlamydomonas sp. UWO 241]|nr:hypothetical protein FOA52_008806 [Chlamydomonas sp. UWO 241]